MFTLTTATSSLIYSKIKSEQGKQRSKQLDNLIVDKEGRMVKMTHEQELNLERFANLMVELIERHADAVDKEEMEKRLSKLNNGAGNEKFPASFVMGEIMAGCFLVIYLSKYFGKNMAGCG